MSRVVVDSARRVLWIDVSKGIAIILVVIGHSIKNPSLLGTVIFSFHIPFFFFISGYLAHTTRMMARPASTAVYNPLKNLLLPYFATGVLAYIYWLLILHQMYSPFLGVRDSNSPMLIASIYGKTWLLGTGQFIAQFPDVSPVGPLWFLVSLFWATLIFYLGLRITSRWTVPCQWLFMIFLTLLGYGVGQVMFLPWSVDISFVAQAPMFFGYRMSMNGPLEKGMPTWQVLSLVGVWLLAIYMGGMSMNDREYHPFLVSIPGAMSGSVLLARSSILLSRIKFVSRVISAIGRNSLMILCFHAMDTGYFQWSKIHQLQPLYSNLFPLYLSGFRLSYSLIIAGIIRRTPILQSLYYQRAVKSPRILKARSLDGIRSDQTCIKAIEKTPALDIFL